MSSYTMRFYSDASYAHNLEPDPWPPSWEWVAMFRAASSMLGLDDRHTLPCHLAGKVALRDRVSASAAMHFVRARVAAHIEQLGREFYLEHEHARTIAIRVFSWLESLEQPMPYVVEPFWPTRDRLLEIDFAAAWRAELDGRFTLTTNFASIVAPRHAMSLTEAKRWVHRRIAIHAGQLAGELGYGLITQVIVRTRIERWLNSFEAS